jgi:hypothetical protein
MEERKLVLSPEREGSGGVPGSVTITADCGHQAWISPSGLAFKLGGGVRAVCEDCVPLETDMTVELMPGQRKELAFLIGEREADEVIRKVQQDPQGMLRAGRTRRRRRR